MLKKIDIHTHLVPTQTPAWSKKFGYGGFVSLEEPACARLVKDDGKVIREIERSLWDTQARLHECEQHGVSAQVLSVLPMLFNYWTQPNDGLEVSRFFNDHVAQVVAKNPDRYVGLGTLPMQAPELAAKELERCVKELGLAGVEIGSHINNWNLSDPALFPVFQTAANTGAAIFIHAHDMMGEQRMGRYALPWLVGMPAESSLAICSLIFGGVFERLPNLRVAVTHGGGSFAATLGRVVHGFMTHPELCAIDNPKNPRDYVGRFWVDSLVHEPAALRFIMSVLGEDQVALGSDFPSRLGEATPGDMIEHMDLSNTVRRKLLVDNALRWLGPGAERLPR